MLHILTIEINILIYSLIYFNLYFNIDIILNLNKYIFMQVYYTKIIYIVYILINRYEIYLYYNII